jgi:polysaccharide pyruvyl transferase WcaK-like protein
VLGGYHDQVVLTASDLKDEMILRPVAKRLGLPLIGLHTPIQQSVDVVGNAQAYIGGRWHPSIFALRGGVPLIPIASKTFKIDALVEMAGLESDVIPHGRLVESLPRIRQQLDDQVAQGEALRSRLRAWASQQAQACRSNVDILSVR